MTVVMLATHSDRYHACAKSSKRHFWNSPPLLPSHTWKHGNMVFHLTATEAKNTVQAVREGLLTQLCGRPVDDELAFMTHQAAIDPIN